MTGRLIKVLVGLAAAAAAALLINRANEEEIAETAELEKRGEVRPLRYLIKCKALATGEWYVQDSTSNPESALAEAEILCEQKPVRVIDSEDGRVLYESTENTVYLEEREN